MEGDPHEVDVFFDATESLGSPATEVDRVPHRSRSLQEIILHDDVDQREAAVAGNAVGDMVIPPILVYRECLNAVKETRALIFGRMGLALTICLLVTPPPCGIGTRQHDIHIE